MNNKTHFTSFQHLIFRIMSKTEKISTRNKCPWDEVWTTLAHGKSLDVLKYLHENKCPLDESWTTLAHGESSTWGV